MEQNIIGRTEEKRRLLTYIQSEQSEFIAIYGRRRIGKTYLVKELFEGQFVFRMTGKENVSLSNQLLNFHLSLSQWTDTERECPSDWNTAFCQLQHYLERLPEGAKLIFLDELPWFDTRGAQFVRALEHFWNDWANYRKDVKLIVCGSATSWMLNNVLRNRGGLHNRVTHAIQLSPFSLAETEKYFLARGFNYARSEIMDIYMAVGGVAYYLSLFDKGYSGAENIDRLCFDRKGELHDEFQAIFRSLYKHSDKYITLVRLLAQKRKGLTREEIVQALGAQDNGNLSKCLSELQECDFIRSYVPYGHSKKGMLYQLIDPYCYFYLSWLSNEHVPQKGFWLKIQGTQTLQQWLGYAFEILCLIHVEHIVTGLHIDGVLNTPGCWTYMPSGKRVADMDDDEDLQRGTQIDLLIDRADKTITLCEMKYSFADYEIQKSYDAHLQQRIRTFQKVTKTHKSIIVTFVTPFGLVDNMYAKRYPKLLTMDALFADIVL